jgi:hypothetical protein
MPYRAPNAYARFVKSAGTVSNPGSSRIMGLIGTGLTYYEVFNEAIQKSSDKPYDLLAHSNVFEILSVSSKPISNGKVSPENKSYTQGDSFSLKDGKVVAWKTIVDPAFQIHANTPAASAWKNKITILPDTDNVHLTQDGEWLVEVIYVDEQEDHESGLQRGAYRVIDNLTKEIIGEYGVDANPKYGIIPGLKLTITDTFVAGEDGSSVVGIGDYVLVTTTAGKTESEAQVDFVTGTGYSAAFQNCFQVLNPEATSAEQKRLMIVDSLKVSADSTVTNYDVVITDKTTKQIKIVNADTNTVIYGPKTVGLLGEYLDIIPGITFILKDIPSDAVNNDKVRIQATRRVDGSAPAEGSTYYVSYKYRKDESDYEPQVFTDYDDIVAEYGNYEVTASGVIINSLSLAAEIAFQNGVSQLVCVQVKKDNDDLAMQDAIDKLTRNLPGVRNINTIVPLTESDSVGAYAMKHVDIMSSEEHAQERMVYLGARRNQPITKNATALDRTVGMIQQAQNYANERVVFVVPGEVVKDIRDLNTGRVNERTLPGCYAAVAVASLGLVNDPAEPLTNKQITGLKYITRLLSETEKNQLAAAGCCVLEQKGSIIKVRHGITTATDDVNAQEITLIQIKDYVIDACRKTCGDLYIGNKNKPSIISDIQYTISSILNQFVSQEVLLGYQGLTVKRSKDDPRQVDVKFEIEAVYPLNYINISFGFASYNG